MELSVLTLCSLLLSPNTCRGWWAASASLLCQDVFLAKFWAFLKTVLLCWFFPASLSMVSPQISKEDWRWVLGVNLVLHVVLTTTTVFPLESSDRAPAFLFLSLSPFHISLFLLLSFYLLPFWDISCSPDWLEFTFPPCNLYLTLTLTSRSSCPPLRSARITAVHANTQL